jgi:hypothetical protein
MSNGGYSAAVANMLKDPSIGATPEQITRIQLLVKDLAAMQADRRDTASNPTNMYQKLRSEGSPTMSNTGNAIVRMFDMAALNAAKDQDEYTARVESPVSARQFNVRGGPLDRMSSLHTTLRKQLATISPTEEMPAFYQKPVFWDSSTKGVPKDVSLTGGPAAPAATSKYPTPTEADLAHVAKHPETRSKFIAHFGREP